MYKIDFNEHTHNDGLNQQENVNRIMDTLKEDNHNIKAVHTDMDDEMFTDFIDFD